MKTNFRTWKKGKHWLYAATALTALAGGVAISQPNFIQTVVVQAQELVNGTAIGTIGNASVIQTSIRDMSSPEFQALVDSILAEKNIEGIKYVTSGIGWTDQTEVVADGLMTLDDTQAYSSTLHKALKRDGFLGTDKGIYPVLPGATLSLKNVGTVEDVETGEIIPVSMEVTYRDVTHGRDGMPTTHADYKKASVFVRNENGVITIGSTDLAVQGASGTGGQSESGGSAGGSYSGRANGYIQNVTWTFTLINNNTGEEIPDDQLLMSMKVSDVDATQWATLQSSDDTSIAYIVSDDTQLRASGYGFYSTSNGADNYDTKELVSNAFVVLRRGNSSTVKFDYTDGAGNHVDIVAGLFGNTGFKLNVDKTGTVKIKKQGVESGTTMYNTNYTLQGNKFKLTNKETQEVIEIETDENGVAQSSDVPFGTYTVEEVSSSNGFAKTFTTQEITISKETTKADVNGKEDQYIEISGTNQEIKGQNTLTKVDSETGATAQGKAELKTAQYALYYADGTPVKWTDASKPQLLTGTKVTSSNVNGKVVEHGDNIVVDVDDNNLSITVGDLAISSYYWQEINAPVGYSIDSTKHEFTISKVDDTTENVVTADTQSADKLIKAKVSLQKLLQASTDLNASGYNDIAFKFTPINNTNASEKTVVTGTKGDEDGFAEVELEYGDWVLTEVKAPEGYGEIKPIYIHMTTDSKTDVITITASHHEDGSQAFSKRTFSQSDDSAEKNTNVKGSLAGVISSSNALISLSRLTLKDNTVTPDDDSFQPEKFVLSQGDFDLAGTLLMDDDDELSDEYTDTNADPYVDKADNNESVNINTETLKRGDSIFYQVWLDTTKFEEDDLFTQLGINDTVSPYFTPKGVETIKVYDGKTGVDVTSYFDITLTDLNLSVSVNDIGKANGVVDTTKVGFGRYYKVVVEGTVANTTPSDTDIINVAEQFVERANQTTNGTNDNTNGLSNNPNLETKMTQKRVNKVKDTTPKPHKFVLFNDKFDITGDSLLDDDSELSDRYADTNNNPYHDKVDNNESGNINTNVVNKKQLLTYQLWLDTTHLTNDDLVSDIGMSDDFDEKMLVSESSTIAIYDSVDGRDVTEYFEIVIKEGVLEFRPNEKALKVITINDKEVLVVDTSVLPMGRYYKAEFTLPVSENATASTDIINTAKQFVETVDPTTGEPKREAYMTEKRVNKTRPASLLPQTGDSEVVWWRKVLGWTALIGGGSLWFKKRQKQTTKK